MPTDFQRKMSPSSGLKKKSEQGTSSFLAIRIILISYLAYSLIMEATCSAETSLDVQLTTRRYFPEDRKSSWGMKISYFWNMTSLKYVEDESTGFLRNACNCTRLHGSMFQKAAIFIVTGVRTSDFTKLMMYQALIHLLFDIGVR
jgi:hypothetical protein